MIIFKMYTVYHDGKSLRGKPAKLLGRRAQGIQFMFSIDGELVTAWFRRRHKSGVYEAIGWNYWFYL